MGKSKLKTSFVCQNCGAATARWEGRCRECGEWNTIVEEIQSPAAWGAGSGEDRGHVSAVKALSLDTAVETSESTSEIRIATKIAELDRVLGGGLVRGSFLLLGGDPGIGKSTLLMQMSGAIAKQGLSVLYVSGEESVQQTALRAQRLGVRERGVQVASLSQLEAILALRSEHQPQVLIVDSIQTIASNNLESAAGSVAQVRECAMQLMHVAKGTNTAVLLIGHVNKEGFIAGPKVLEHMVDTVLSFEGEPHMGHRLLRSLKNRFGPTHELGVFRMEGEGLAEVTNSSEVFLADRTGDPIGAAVHAGLEGSRPILCEVQALTIYSHLANARRTTTGVDQGRAQLIAAVLERHAGLELRNKDIFVNVVGGLRLQEPAADLAIAAALISSEMASPIPNHSCFVGEIGLTGEIRSVQHLDLRIKEALRLGFRRLVLPARREKKGVRAPEGVRVHSVENIAQLRSLLGQRESSKASAPVSDPV